jgi:DNA invertase Pin-like site-specific DNA recombinase
MRVRLRKYVGAHLHKSTLQRAFRPRIIPDIERCEVLQAATKGKFVAYYRVSTQRQGRSGLGLEAQQTAVRDFLTSGASKLLAEFTEVESGKSDSRPQLAAAIKRCRMTGATLVISKIDRLSRDIHFLTGLQKAGVAFVATDNPQANQLTIHILIAVAQHEREMISRRTRDALAAARARGVVMGGYRGGPVVDGRLGGAAVREAADAFAGMVGPMIHEQRQAGATLQQIADRLAAEGISTARGGRWTPTAVRNVILREGVR